MTRNIFSSNTNQPFCLQISTRMQRTIPDNVAHSGRFGATSTNCIFQEYTSSSCLVFCRNLYCKFHRSLPKYQVAIPGHCPRRTGARRQTLYRSSVERVPSFEHYCLTENNAAPTTKYSGVECRDLDRIQSSATCHRALPFLEGPALSEGNEFGKPKCQFSCRMSGSSSDPVLLHLTKLSLETNC